MKKYLASLLFVVLVFSPVYVYAQDITANNTLENIFEISKNKKYETAAGLLAYDGSDEDRKFRDTFKPAEKSELKVVKRKLKKIKALIDISDNYTFGEAIKTNKEGVEWYIQPVTFNSGTQKLITNFEFVKINGKFVLADID